MVHESRHDALEFLFAHLPMRHANPRFRTDFLHERRERINRFDAVVHHIHLTAAIDLKIDRILNDNRLELHNDRLNGQSIAGRRLDDGHIAQAAQRHVQRAGDRRGRHGHHVHDLLDLLQALFVRHSEALFFIDDHQAEIMKLDVL